MTLDDPILTPEKLIEYRRSVGALRVFTVPKTVIFVPQKSLARKILCKYFVSKIKGFLGEFYVLKKFGGQIAFSTGFGIGAPGIAGLTDEFAALGVRQFGLIGLAGGLQESFSAGSMILSTGSIRGEGVTRHYLPPGERVESSADILGRVEDVLESRSIPFSKGTTWTTDAPFRELRRDVIKHQKDGVLAVDMEAAGMLGVAKAQGLPAFAAFSIADQLSGGVWRMSKDLRHAQSNLALLFDAVCQALK